MFDTLDKPFIRDSMVLLLQTQLPVAKKDWKFHCVDTRFHIEDVIDIAIGTMDKTIEKMLTYRSNSPRPFKRPPEYIKFRIRILGNPQYQPAKTIGEFNIYLEDMRVEVVKDWIRY
jgi:hypothetical protein